jgi:hypothetical protein
MPCIDFTHEIAGNDRRMDTAAISDDSKSEFTGPDKAGN